MNKTSIFAAVLCFSTLLFLSFASPKKSVQADAEQNEITTTEDSQMQLIKIKGKITRSEDGSFLIINKAKSKSRTTYKLIPAANFEETFNQLESLEGKSVQIIGTIVERKNLWNMTIGVMKIN